MFLRMLALVSCGSLSLCAQVKKGEILTVCDLLAQRVLYIGQSVTLRGQVVGEGEGLYLQADGCRPLVTDGYTWPAPTGIWLAYPTAEQRQTGAPAPDVEQVDLRKLRDAGPGAKVYATVTGRFETRARFPMPVRGDGNVKPYGYGHLASAPAQILLTGVRDVKVVSPPAAHGRMAPSAKSQIRESRW
jgi:hypothetical protein